MILIFSKFLMDFYKNNPNTAILKIIKIFFEVIQFIENLTQFDTHLFKDLKDLSSMLFWKASVCQ